MGDLAANLAVGAPTSSIWDFLRRSYLKSRFNNPHSNAAMASPPTVTNPTSMPVGFKKYNVQGASGKPSGIGYLTGGLPSNYAGGFKFPSVTLVTSGNVTTTTSGNIWRARFIVDAAAPAFNLTTSGSVYRFIVDSGTGPQYVSTAGTSNSGGNNWIQLSFGSRAIRKITVESTAGQGMFSVAVLPNEGVYADSVGRRAVFLGDSIFTGTLAGSNIYQADGVSQCLADMLGISDAWMSAVGGTGVLNPGSDRTMLQRLNSAINPNVWTQDAPPCDLFILGAGTNDATGSYSYANLQAGYQQVLQLLLGQYPTTPILVIGCPPGKPGPSEWPAACDLAIKAACAAVSSPYVLYMPNAARLPTPITWGSGNTTSNTSGSVTMTAAPSAATSATLTAGFPGPTGLYTITFSGGTQKTITLTNNSTTVTWSGAVTDASATLLYNGINGSLTLTAAAVAGATSATLSANFNAAGGSNSTAYVQFDSGEVRQVTLTNGSAAISWTNPLLFSCSTTAITWQDTTTGPGPNDVYYTSTSGAHPVAAGALAYAQNYADAIYGLLTT